jgi:hypothetical protein
VAVRRETGVGKQKNVYSVVAKHQRSLKKSFNKMAQLCGGKGGATKRRVLDAL